MLRTGLACAAIVACSRIAVAEPVAAHAINTAASSARFAIQHIFVDRVTGLVPIVSGAVTLADGSPTPLNVSAVLDATRIRTDEPDRDRALESPDYFDAQRFPTWTFASTSIVARGPAAFTMEGTLTMHGVAQPEHLDVVVRSESGGPVYHAVGHIDRHAFGMRGAHLDPVIGNDAEVTLDIAIK